MTLSYRSCSAYVNSPEGGYRTSVLSRQSQRVTMIARHRAVREAATAQVALPAGQDSVRAAKVTAVLIIKRCRTVLTQRCRYITK
jgi:hypothetical protein